MENYTISVTYTENEDWYYDKKYYITIDICTIGGISVSKIKFKSTYLGVYSVGKRPKCVIPENLGDIWSFTIRGDSYDILTIERSYDNLSIKAYLDESASIRLTLKYTEAIDNMLNELKNIYYMSDCSKSELNDDSSDSQYDDLYNNPCNDLNNDPKNIVPKSPIYDPIFYNYYAKDSDNDEENESNVEMQKN